MRPYLWMLCGAVAFATMSALAHALRSAVPWQAIALARASVPLAITGGMLVLAGLKWPLPGPLTLWMRSCAGSISLVCTFYALTRLPVSDVLTLCNLMPLWVAVLSWPMLGERPTWDVWVSVMVGLLGVVLMEQAHAEAGNLFASAIAVIASMSSAIALISLHRVEGIDSRAIVFHFSLVSLGFCLLSLWAPYSRVNQSAETFLETITTWNGPTLGLMLGVGFAATIGQFCLTKAYLTGSPARVSVVGLSQVGFAMVFDLLIWHRSFGPITILGMALVVGSTGWVMLSRPVRSTRDEAMRRY